MFSCVGEMWSFSTQWRGTLLLITLFCRSEFFPKSFLSTSLSEHLKWRLKETLTVIFPHKIENLEFEFRNATVLKIFFQSAEAMQFHLETSRHFKSHHLKHFCFPFDKIKASAAKYKIESIDFNEHHSLSTSTKKLSSPIQFISMLCSSSLMLFSVSPASITNSFVPTQPVDFPSSGWHHKNKNSFSGPWN